MTNRDLGSEIELVRADLVKLRADVAALVQALGESASKDMHNQLEAVRGRVHRIAADADAHGRNDVDALAAKLEERPLTTLLVAFGAGIVAGRAFAR